MAAGIIENAEGLVLLAERPVGKRLAGLWEFPGGKIEAGESGEEAIARELKEELELDVELVEAMGVFTHNYDWGPVRLHVYRVRALNTPQPTIDVQNFRWVRPQEILTTELAPADIEPLKAYLAKCPINFR